MEKLLFKKFKKVYLELLIVLEKAKTWSLPDNERKILEGREKSITESYQTLKEIYEKGNQKIYTED